MVIHKHPHHAQSFAHHVTTPVLSFCRACHGSHRECTQIPENTSFEWNGLFAHRILVWDLLTLRFFRIGD